MKNVDHDRNVIAFEVSVMTKPIGRSEAFEYIAPTRTTLYNTYDSAQSYYNFFDISNWK